VIYDYIYYTCVFNQINFCNLLLQLLPKSVSVFLIFTLLKKTFIPR